MQGSRNKIPSKKISSGNVARRDLILALKGYITHNPTINAVRFFIKIFVTPAFLLFQLNTFIKKVDKLLKAVHDLLLLLSRLLMIIYTCT
jgi:hypothetical protein